MLNIEKIINIILTIAIFFGILELLVFKKSPLFELNL